MIEMDSIYMAMALQLAREAAKDGEVPVGAVAVKEGKVVGKGRNRVEALNDPTAHAEIEAITAAANTLGSKFLDDVTLYVNLEPCPMCSGALVLSRVGRVVYGADDPKTGSCGSLYRLHDDPRLNHTFHVHSGLMAEESKELLGEFFRKLREKRKQIKSIGDSDNETDR